MSCPGCGDAPAFPIRRRADWALWLHPEIQRMCLVPTAPACGPAYFTECHDCNHGRLLRPTALALRCRGGMRITTATVATMCPRCRGHACLPGFVMPS